MRVQVLYVPGCPHAAVLVARLVHLLSGQADIEQQEVGDQNEAVALGMRGSPTLLVNGTDPFPVRVQPPGLSCRLYRDENGSLAGAPSLLQLRRALGSGGIRQA